MNRSGHTGLAGYGKALVAGVVRISMFLMLVIMTGLSRGESVFLFTLTDLGTLGGSASRGEAINDLGWVVGESETADGETCAFLWTPGKGMRNLGTLGGQVSRAFAINNHGVVVGESATHDQSTRAFIWTEEHGMLPLSGDTGVLFSAAYSINDRGQVVGTQEDQTGIHAVMWWQGKTTLIQRLPGAGYIQPLDVNNDGDVAGQIETGTDETQISHAFYFRRALNARNLADFRLISPHHGSAAVAINESGDAAGSIMLDSSRVKAFRYIRSAGVTILDDRDAHYSSASDINGHDQIVGSSISTYTSDETACTWFRGKWFDLNETTAREEEWQLTQALGINETGHITGYGVHEGDYRAYVLNPTGRSSDDWPLINVTVHDQTEPDDTERILVIKADVVNDVLIRRVIFYMAGQNLGSVETPPYEWGWQGTLDGEVDVYAVMADNKGRIINSPRVRIQ